MKIDILCGSGSPQGIVYSDIFGQNGRIGVGGAELAMLTIAEGWMKRGHDVTIYNNPRKDDGILNQKPTSSFDKSSPRDVVIFFREPNSKVVDVTGLKVFWSCDQYTIGDFRHFSEFVDKVITISPYHSEYFKLNYGIEKSISIDLPVRTWEYTPTEKIKNRLIFTSVPDRGLEHVAQMFPVVKREIPDATLTITSDYRLWGNYSPDNQSHVQRFLHMDGVSFLGGVTREVLVKEQLKSQIHFYPCSYEEMFCIACAENQVAGSLPITTVMGALGTTNMGVLINGKPGDPRFQNIMIETTVKYLQDEKLNLIQKELQQRAMERFSLDRILDEWDRLIFEKNV